jgi:tetratricopeptide (TPR) repeat protein
MPARHEKCGIAELRANLHHKVVKSIGAKLGGLLATTATIMAAVLMASCSSRLPEEKILAAYQENGQYAALAVHYPLDGTVFPPEIVPPSFSWQDRSAATDTWLVLVQFSDHLEPMHLVCQQAEWTPAPKAWEEIKRRSREGPAQVTVLGLQRASPLRIISRGRVSLSTSKDEVRAPLFYREVNLPFIEAVKDPSRIRWRFGSIASAQPPAVVLEHLPVCGNCHSFSQNGGVLGMDVDYANNKGSYVITRVAKDMALASSDIITWDDYRREDKQQTFGLLSQVSPDGQVVVSTVKDKSVFVAKPDRAFSQLFFPIKGILVVFHRNSGKFQALPGADDPAYVQSNPSWSPDGKYIVFARSKAYKLSNPGAESRVLLREEDCAEFVREGKTFQFDLYRIPYNGGRGGKPEPLPGASNNGRSNYFAKYSPDGKWIIFCQSQNYMLLQPDSELFIIPAEGGEPRRLRCNTPRMNSWHSWSPNSRWLVFSSKANSDFTQLFLTHIDDRGESTPPVLLAHFTALDRAANIPEFVNAAPDAIGKIREQFLNDYSRARAGFVFEGTGDIDRAIAEYQKALEINPKNVHAHQRLGFLLVNYRQQLKEGLAHTAEALRLDPNDACAHYDAGMALVQQQQFDPAIQHLAKAVELMPEGADGRYDAPAMRYSLGAALVAKGDYREAASVLTKAAELDPKNAQIHYALALALAVQGLIDEPIKQYTLAHSLRPDMDTVPEYHHLMSVNLAKAGQFRQALESAQKALQLTPPGSDPNQVQAIKAQLEACRQQLEGR